MKRTARAGWRHWKWASGASLLLAISPWGCGGTAHEPSDAVPQGGGAGVGAGSPAGYSGVESGGAPSGGAPTGGTPTGGAPTGMPSGGSPPYYGGGSGASSAGAPPMGNCDLNVELTIRTQADADRVAGCSIIHGVYVADVAEPLVIDWPSLTTVNGELHFARAAQLTRISLPNLRQLNGELYVKGNAALKTVDLPGLTKISGDPDLNSAILVEDNPRLTTLTLSLDLRVKGLTLVRNNPLLCHVENLLTLQGSNALLPIDLELPQCAYPPDIGVAGAGGSADF